MDRMPKTFSGFDWESGGEVACLFPTSQKAPKTPKMVHNTISLKMRGREEEGERGKGGGGGMMMQGPQVRGGEKERGGKGERGEGGRGKGTDGMEEGGISFFFLVFLVFFEFLLVYFLFFVFVFVFFLFFCFFFFRFLKESPVAKSTQNSLLQRKNSGRCGKRNRGRAKISYGAGPPKNYMVQKLGPPPPPPPIFRRWERSLLPFLRWRGAKDVCGKEGEPMSHRHGMKSLPKDKQNFILLKCTRSIHRCAQRCLAGSAVPILRTSFQGKLSRFPDGCFPFSFSLDLLF